MGRAEGIVQAAKRAAERAKNTVHQGGEVVGTTVRSGREIGDAAIAKSTKAASAALGKGASVSADVAVAAARLVPQRLESIGNPALPLSAEWGTGFGQFLSGMAGVPSALGPVLARLDQVGSVSVSAANVQFDGEVVEWRNVESITIGSPIDALSSKAAADVVERIRKLLPPFPGRTLVLRQAVELLIALCLAAVQSASRSGDDEPVRVVTSLRYAGRLHQKELRPGFFALLLCAMKPAVTAAIVETSRRFGPAVSVEPPSRAGTRAVAVQQLALQLRQQIATTEEAID